ncbi:MAG TPA: peptidylprolyl isomerase [Aggregatilineales bacterium]|nr:peptidylprolyl isomerase [Aggregatilineales bacterium]
MSRLKFLMATLTLVLSACATAQATQPPQANNSIDPTQNVTATPHSANAALVNDQPIPMDALNGEVERELDGMRSVGTPLPSDMTAFRDKVLDVLIQQKLIEQAAVIQGIKVTDADVDIELQTLISLAGGADKWKEHLAQDHMTEPELRVSLRSSLITQKMRDIVTASVPTRAEQVHARHILVVEQATASDILNQIKAGADFAQLAQRYSLDQTTKATGGDLGWFSRGQLLQKSVEDAAFALAPNQIGGPVKSALGYHIIQTLERVPDRPIDAETRARLMEDTFDAWLQSLVKGAKIVKYPNGTN